MRINSQKERIDMILVIGECEENCLLASRVYAQRYPNRRHPNKRSLENLLQLFRRTGTVSYNEQERYEPVTGNEENEHLVMLSLFKDPYTSQRKISEATGISRQSIERITKKHKFHPYRI